MSTAQKQASANKQQALQKARGIFTARKNSAAFPENAWHGISRDWDLLLCLENGQPHAYLYPVDETGRTEVMDGITVG